ncbi:MAG TPA: DsrE family protein [Xanthomonadales bacterium]|nr:DsrE family protein [Xanthomonadales bacterium]
MTRRPPFRLGLVLRSAPYAQRSARTQLDVALLAATLDCDLRLFFTGAGVMQLVIRGSTADAQLPAAYRAWASLPGLFETAELRAFAEPSWLERLDSQGLQPCLPLEACSVAGMRREWMDCDRVLVL